LIVTFAFLANGMFSFPGMPMMPGMQPTLPFSSLPGVAEKRGTVAMLFGDGLDSKPLTMMIAAGMLPRYAPVSTDGYDSSEMWLTGMSPMGGPPMTEQQVIDKAKFMYPMSAQLGHPENEELMPVWSQVVLNGLTRAPDVVDGHNANTKSHGSPGFGGESEAPEMEHPETEHHEMGFVFSSEGVTTNVLPSGTDSTAPSGFHFSTGFGGEAAEEGEHCPFVPIDQCVYPCMKFGTGTSAICTGEARLQQALALYHPNAKESTSKGLTSMEILYCLWGLTTGLLCGVSYMVWTRKGVRNQNNLKEALTLA